MQSELRTRWGAVFIIAWRGENGNKEEFFQAEVAPGAHIEREMQEQAHCFLKQISL